MVSNAGSTIRVNKVPKLLHDYRGWRSFQREYIAYCKEVNYLDAIHPDDRPISRKSASRYDTLDFYWQLLSLRGMTPIIPDSPATMAQRALALRLIVEGAKEAVDKMIKGNLRWGNGHAPCGLGQFQCEHEVAAKMFIAERVDDQLLAACGLDIQTFPLGAHNWYNKLKRRMELNNQPLLDLDKKEYQDTMLILSTISETDEPRQTRKKLREWRRGMNNARMAGVLDSYSSILWWNDVVECFYKEWAFLLDIFVEENEYSADRGWLTFRDFTDYILNHSPGAVVGDYSDSESEGDQIYDDDDPEDEYRW